MSDYPAGLELDLRVCIRVQWPVTGFVADPQYPQVTAANLWSEWLDWLLHQNFPQDHRVFCGVACPKFSGDIWLCQDAAEIIWLSLDTSDPVAAANQIVASQGGA